MQIMGYNILYLLRIPWLTSFRLSQILLSSLCGDRWRLLWQLPCCRVGGGNLVSLPSVKHDVFSR